MNASVCVVMLLLSSLSACAQKPGLLVLPDGSMLITDDGTNKIWRVHYEGAGGLKK